jgi:hypothetical protein
VYIVLVVALLPKHERHPDTISRCGVDDMMFKDLAYGIGFTFLAVHIISWTCLRRVVGKGDYAAIKKSSCCTSQQAVLVVLMASSFSVGIALLVPMSALGPGALGVWYIETLLLSLPLAIGLTFLLLYSTYSFCKERRTPKQADVFDAFGEDWVWWTIVTVYCVVTALSIWSIFQRGVNYPCGNRYHDPCPSE